MLGLGFVCLVMGGSKSESVLNFECFKPPTPYAPHQKQQLFIFLIIFYFILFMETACISKATINKYILLIFIF